MIELHCDCGWFQSLINQVYLSNRFSIGEYCGYQSFQSLINQVYLSNFITTFRTVLREKSFNPLLVRSTFQTIVFFCFIIVPLNVSIPYSSGPPFKHILTRTVSPTIDLFQSLIHQVHLSDFLHLSPDLNGSHHKRSFCEAKIWVNAIRLDPFMPCDMEWRFHLSLHLKNIYNLFSKHINNFYCNLDFRLWDFNFVFSFD